MMKEQFSFSVHSHNNPSNGARSAFGENHFYVVPVFWGLIRCGVWWWVSDPDDNRVHSRTKHYASGGNCKQYQHCEFVCWAEQRKCPCRQRQQSFHRVH